MVKCEICDVEEKKYKCPNCSIPYCSVKCYETHKENDGCNKLEEVIPPNTNEDESMGASNQTRGQSSYQFPTEHTVPIEKLKLLAKNETLLKLLENPHLRSMLTALCKTKNVNHAMNMVMLEPIFVEFAMECLKTVEEEEEEENSEEKEQIRQFVNTIKQLINEQ